MFICRSCVEGFVCLELPLIPNPYDNKLSFDDFGHAFLAAFQLTLLDDWGIVYRKVCYLTHSISILNNTLLLFPC